MVWRAQMSEAPRLPLDGPRAVTRELLDEFFAWTRTAPMFLSSRQGGWFAEELRAVFSLAYEALESRDGGKE
jgi:hypothetical protein